ncbi:MAG: class I SAM-dependent methyltransferase [Actinomycetota bacterium]
MDEIDPTRLEALMGTVGANAGGVMATAIAYMGDRLGIWSAMADGQSASPATVAERTGLNERYVREWLGGMTTAGYVTHEAADGTFSLSPEQALVFATENTPASMGGMFQMIMEGTVPAIPRVLESFRDGGGVHQSEYGHGLWEGMHRATAGSFEGLLVDDWLNRIPDVRDRLASGIDVADVGCGWGRASIVLARAFPESTFVGYDAFGPSVERATAEAAKAGVSDRVRFEVHDAATPIPADYDLITTFDVIHDAVDPQGILGAIRTALRPGGHFLCVDINCSPELDDMAGPMGTLFHGFSLTYCMTTSLANDGVGLGTVGLHPPKLRELGEAAGYSSIDHVDVENPFNTLYVLAK